MEKQSMDNIPPKEKEPDLMEGDDGELKEIMEVDTHKHHHAPTSANSHTPINDIENHIEEKKEKNYKIEEEKRPNYNIQNKGSDDEYNDVGGDSDEEVKLPGIINKISERLRAPIYNVDELEEEIDLNKRMAFGLNDCRTNLYFFCYRCKREGRSYIRYEFTSTQIAICLITFVLCLWCVCFVPFCCKKLYRIKHTCRFCGTIIGDA